MENATCFNFVGEPSDDDVETGQYNLSKNAAPYLFPPKDKPVKEELEQIQPPLDHIKASLCAGEEKDYEVFMGWVTLCCQVPQQEDRLDIFIGEQGTDKGSILGNLLTKIFDKLWIHCTNFGSVTLKKMFVLQVQLVLGIQELCVH